MPIADPNPGPTPVPQATPVAVVTARPERASSRWWLVTALCVLSSIGLYLAASRNRGLEIVIEFSEGHGIKPQDRLRHHGIDVGEVTQVELSRSLDKVLVSVQLDPKASHLAVEGSQFWIVRPSLSIESVSGLETILGAKYLSVKPGPVDGSRSSKFVGLESPPIGSVKDGSLEIFLDGPTRGGLTNGAPILFRGYRVGSIVQVGLASDARSVRARCAIDPEFRDLIRRNTKFWNRSGWRLNVGFSGIKVDADSLAQILTGGVEMATPENSGGAVSTGHTFVLHREAEAEWQEWQPSLGHGAQWQSLENRLPSPVRIALRWQERSFGFRVNEQTLGWCLPLDDGSILCLREQIVAPKNSLANTAVVEFLGVSVRPEEITILADDDQARVVRFRPNTAVPGGTPTWPAGMLKSKLQDPVRIVVACGDPGNAIAVDDQRLTSMNQAWLIDSPQLSSSDVLGAPVVHAETNQVIGLIRRQDKQTIVELLP
jgi:paraquat-inducible protein B